MTQPAQQPEAQDQLDELRDWVIGRCTSGAYFTKWEIDNQISIIRSRPHPHTRTPAETEQEANKNLDEFIITRAELFCLLPRNPPIALLDEMVSRIISDGTVKEHNATIRNSLLDTIIIDLNNDECCPKGICDSKYQHCKDCYRDYFNSLRSKGAP